MKNLRLALAVVLGSSAVGCASKQTPVPLMAEPVAVTALVGEWNGEYSSTQTGRSGSIVFRLKSVTDTAYGDVVMIPRRNVASVGPGDVGASRDDIGSPPPQVLAIRFVRLEGSNIVGRMAPYVDPDCGCRLLTVFTGDFSNASTIEGTFETTGPGTSHALTRGKWKVTRATQ